MQKLNCKNLKITNKNHKYLATKYHPINTYKKWIYITDTYILSLFQTSK